MRLTGLAFATLLAVTLALAPQFAFARAGGGFSGGSRGARTYSAPPVTRTAPGTAAPMQRSVTPQSAPRPAGSGFAPSRPGFFGSGFGAGLMGGLIGAGIGGMLFGSGMFGGVHGFGGFLGLLLQIFIVVMVVRWLIRRFMPSRQPALAGPAAMYGRQAQEMPIGGGNAGMGSGSTGDAPIAITPADYQAFEQVLQHVQAGWSAQDINALRGSVTPEMLSYFADQLSDQASRGVRNTVTDVKLEQGDLAEAWAEPGREYASVAMRFSMIDVTRDGAGRVVDGDVAQRTQASEVWTFLRAPAGRWILSAIQQAG